MGGTTVGYLFEKQPEYMSDPYSRFQDTLSVFYFIKTADLIERLEPT